MDSSNDAESASPRRRIHAKQIATVATVAVIVIFVGVILVVSNGANNGHGAIYNDTLYTLVLTQHELLGQTVTHQIQPRTIVSASTGSYSYRLGSQSKENDSCPIYMSVSGVHTGPDVFSKGSGSSIIPVERGRTTVLFCFSPGGPNVAP